MGQIDQRAAKRIECDFPVRIVAHMHTIDGVACDASRTGLRIRIPGRALGVHRLSNLVQIARRVSSVLGEAFVVELHPDRLGGLVRKTLYPMRIGQRDWESADIELGCRIGEGIADDEAGMLGLALPRVGAEEAPPELLGVSAPSVRDAEPTKPTAAPRIDAPTGVDASTVAGEAAPVAEFVLKEEEFDLTGQRRKVNWRAFVKGARGSGRPAFVTAAELVTPKGAVLRVPDVARLGLDGDVGDVSRFVVALGDAYGDSIALRVMDGARHVWSGPAEIREAEFPPECPGQALLTVSFARELRLAEQREMGLV